MPLIGGETPGCQYTFVPLEDQHPMLESSTIMNPITTKDRTVVPKE
jgi:hypothetical protein